VRLFLVHLMDSSKKTVQTVVKVGADGLFQFCFNLPAYFHLHLGIERHIDLEELEKKKEMERGIGTGNDHQSSRHRYIHVTNVTSTNCHLHKNTTCHGRTKNMR